MADQVETFTISQFGGANYDDLPSVLVSRAYALSDNGQQRGFVQRAPVEATRLRNMDLDQQGMRKRRGSALLNDFSASLASNDFIIGMHEFVAASSGTRIRVAVGAKAIYTDQSGSWAQINASTGSAYAHNADVTKCSFAEVDGHLFIGLDGNNYIQAYREGADLDAQMASGNTYEHAQGGGTSTITGTWKTGCYMLAEINSRLAFSAGNAVVDFTPMARTSSSGIYDFGGGTAGFYQATGRVSSLWSFTPLYSDSLNQTLYIGSGGGMEAVTGFTATDAPHRIEGGKAPMNHRSAATARNWLIYLTQDGSLVGLNGSRVIDLGRRLKNTALSGPLDTIYRTESEVSAFGYYDDARRQAHFHFTSANGNFNDVAVVCDFKLEEPALDESQPSYERHVRMLHHAISTPGTNDWLAHAITSQATAVGVLKTGVTYTLDSGDNDLGSIAIDALWWGPDFDGGAAYSDKQWLDQGIRFKITGAWPVAVDLYLDGSDASTKSWSYTNADAQQVLGTMTLPFSLATTGNLKGSTDIDRTGESLSWSLGNSTASQTFIVVSMNLRYAIGTEER